MALSFTYPKKKKNLLRFFNLDTFFDVLFTDKISRYFSFFNNIIFY